VDHERTPKCGNTPSSRPHRKRKLDSREQRAGSGIMEIFHWLVYCAMAATIFSLGSGVVTMVLEGDEGDAHSVQWMAWRVGWQAIAVALVALAAYGVR
jgi:hypothetical protein